MNIEWVEILKILIAYVLALPAGWDRERHERSAGLRTFPLVAVASCAFVSLSIRFFGEHVDAQSRVIQGLIGGVGFIGAGTILHSAKKVHGTATASSLLITGAIGMAVAFGYYDAAVVLSIISFLTLRLFTAWKELHEPDRESKDSTSSQQTA